jgi:hypothetical protein
LEAQAAIENTKQLQARMMPSGNKSIKTTATINPIARSGTPKASRTMQIAPILGGELQESGRQGGIAIAAGPAEFTCFALSFRWRSKFGLGRAIFIGGAVAQPAVIKI